jgi:hypothetical protein
VLKIIDERQEWRSIDNLFYHRNVEANAHVTGVDFAQAQLRSAHQKSLTLKEGPTEDPAKSMENTGHIR